MSEQFIEWNCRLQSPSLWEMYVEAMTERAERITRLIETKPFMTPRAAAIVVDAAMFGKGCIEGKVRAEQQKRIDKGLPAHVSSYDESNSQSNTGPMGRG